MYGLEPSFSAALILTSDFLDLYGPLIVLAVIIVTLISIFKRQGRNAVLEQMLSVGDFGSPEAFHGRLVVQEHRQGVYLQLGPDSVPTTWWKAFNRSMLDLNYRPLFVAPIREATFDGRSCQITLRTKKSTKTAGFGEFTAIRMREFALGRSLTSVWIIELIPQKGKAIQITASPAGSREASFNYTAPVVKAISAITGLPIQVHVAGNVWTPGWPPKIPSISH